MLKSTFSGLTQSLTMWVYVCDAQGLSVYSKNLIQHGDPKNKTLVKQNTQKNVTAIIQRPNKIINHNQLQVTAYRQNTNTEHTGRHLTKSIHLDEYPRRPWWSQLDARP